MGGVFVLQQFQESVTRSGSAASIRNCARQSSRKDRATKERRRRPA